MTKLYVASLDNLNVYLTVVKEIYDLPSEYGESSHCWIPGLQIAKLIVTSTNTNNKLKSTWPGE